MRIYLIYLLVSFSSVYSLAQEGELEKEILRGNWKYSYLNFDARDTIDHQIGDTVLFHKVPKRLKFKRERPVRFKQNGTVTRPSVCFGCCGTVAVFESLWALKWRKFSTWKIEKNESETILLFRDFRLQLLDSKKKKYTFVISEEIKSE